MAGAVLSEQRIDRLIEAVDRLETGEVNRVQQAATTAGRSKNCDVVVQVRIRQATNQESRRHPKYVRNIVRRIRELRRRGLDKQDLDGVLRNPGQRVDVRPCRVVLQSKTQEGEAEYLLRIFVDIDRNPAEVVTAYRTTLEILDASKRVTDTGKVTFQLAE